MYDFDQEVMQHTPHIETTKQSYRDVKNHPFLSLKTMINKGYHKRVVSYY